MHMPSDGDACTSLDSVSLGLTLFGDSTDWNGQYSESAFNMKLPKTKQKNMIKINMEECYIGVCETKINKNKASK